MIKRKKNGRLNIRAMTMSEFAAVEEYLKDAGDRCANAIEAAIANAEATSRPANYYAEVQYYTHSLRYISHCLTTLYQSRGKELLSATDPGKP